jgi:hypothetical protein
MIPKKNPFDTAHPTSFMSVYRRMLSRKYAEEMFRILTPTNQPANSESPTHSTTSKGMETSMAIVRGTTR